MLRDGCVGEELAQHIASRIQTKYIDQKDEKIKRLEEKLNNYEDTLKVYAMDGMWDQLGNKWCIFRSDCHGFVLARDILQQ